MGISDGNVLESPHLHKNISDPSTCQRRCQHNFECNYFVFDLNNLECFLKRSDAGKVYKLDHISGPKNCGKWNRNMYFKRHEMSFITRQICPTPCCIHILLFTECYEISKDIRTENVIRHENAILAPFECYDICTNTIGCNFYLINHRVTPMRGCWLFYNDPHFKSSTQQSQIIGSSYCSKTSKVVISNNIHFSPTIAYLFRIQYPFWSIFR